MTFEEIARNVAQVKEEIRRAAVEAGRQPEEILLAAATKTNDAAHVRAAVEAGADICGENRVQEMLEKMLSAPMKGYRCTLSDICRRTRSDRWSACVR